MLSRVRSLLWRAVAPWVGETPLPMGRTARDRRLLRQALAQTSASRVLVVGPGLAARQALPAVQIDVAGTNPRLTEVNICSAVRTPDSLPRTPWDLVIISDPADLGARLQAVRDAASRSAQLVVMHRGQRKDPAGDVLAIADVASIEKGFTRKDHRLWLARLR